jgi:hypothetical protein
MLGAMFSERNKELQRRDRAGRHFVDRDGELFRYVLSYLRDGALELGSSVPLHALRNEASYFALRGLEELVENEIAERKLDEELASQRATARVADCVLAALAARAAQTGAAARRGKRRTVSLESDASDYSFLSESGRSDLAPSEPDSGDAGDDAENAQQPIEFDRALFTTSPDF